MGNNKHDRSLMNSLGDSEITVKRARYIGIVIFIANVFVLLAYYLALKQKLLHWAASKPEAADAQYYTAVFENLSVPVIFSIIIAGCVVAFAPGIINLLGRFANSKNWMLWVIATVAVIQFTIAFTIDTVPHSDSLFYLELAHRLSTDFSYTTAEGVLTAFWPPGYPAILAVVQFIAGESLVTIRVLHILIYAGLLLILYNMFKRETKHQLTIVLFMILYAFHPNGLMSVNAVLSEFPSMLALWSGLYFLLKKEQTSRTVMYAGIFLAVAAYIKPIALGVIAFVLLYEIFSGRTWAAAKRQLTFVFVVLVIIAPWGIRNYIAFNEFVPISTNGGLNFYIGNNPDATGKYEHASPPVAQGLNEAERSREAFKAGIEFIVSRPIEAIKTIPKKLFYSFWRGDASVTWSLKHTANNVSPVLISTVFYITNTVHYIMLFGLLCFVYSIRDFLACKKRNIIFPLLIVYFFAVVVVFFGSERFLAPIMPLLLWFFVSWLTGEYSKREGVST